MILTHADTICNDLDKNSQFAVWDTHHQHRNEVWVLDWLYTVLLNFLLVVCSRVRGELKLMYFLQKLCQISHILGQLQCLKFLKNALFTTQIFIWATSYPHVDDDFEYFCPLFSISYLIPLTHFTLISLTIFYLYIST